jgi:hypothetical protein
MPGPSVPSVDCRQQGQRISSIDSGGIQSRGPAQLGFASGGLADAPRPTHGLLIHGGFAPGVGRGNLDGGKTWRQQATFGEDRAGSIQEFFFRDKNNGSFIFDRGRGADGRYQLYETTDGGITWSVKQENDAPIRLKRPPGADNWRARADGATQAYHLERREGEKWVSVASFAVKPAMCKPSQ